MKAKNHGQTKKVVPSTLLAFLCENHWRKLGYKLVNPVVVFRYCVGKYMFDLEEDFTETDRIALFTAWEKMGCLAAVDRKFKEKHGFYIFMCRHLVMSLNNGHSREDRINFQRSWDCYLSHGRKYFSAHAYFGLKIQGQKLYELWVQTRFPKRFPPKKHVGVGYNDSGTAKDDAYDGNPHWVDVAMSEIKVVNSESATEKIDNYFKTLSEVHELQSLGTKEGKRKTERYPNPKG